MIPYIMLSNAVSLNIKGDQYVINNTHPNFSLVVDAIKAKKWADIEQLVDIPKAIVAASKGLTEVVNGQVYYNKLPVHSHLATTILNLMRQGFDVDPWVKFMDKLYTNPDPFSITQLYTFLERAKLPICPDGDFLAYKYVNNDYTDCHTGTFDNSIGNIVTEPRELCDNNPNNHCSKGLHFCSKGYLNSYTQGRRILLVKVNPRDVVSVPNDHNCEKARACRYEVVGELDKDYSFEDMEHSAVLPDPRDTKALNTPKGKDKNNTKPSALQHRVIMSGAPSVRELAKNLGVTQAEIINSAGKFYKFTDTSGGVGARFISLTKSGQKYYNSQS